MIPEGASKIFRSRKSQITWLLQFTLLLMTLYGAMTWNAGIMVNSVVCLILTFLPALIERDFGINMSPGLVLWLTLAVFLHAAGTLGPYATVWWWDHLTHALSSSVVAGAGYVFFRSVDEHYEEIEIPDKLILPLVFIFVIAFGVVWEVLEFGIGIAAPALGIDKVLAQHGVEDTMKDLVFDTAGAIFVGMIGEVYLSDIVGKIKERMEGKKATRLSDSLAR